MWPQPVNVSGTVAPDPMSAIPIVRDDRNTGENHGTVYTPAQAAEFAYNELRSADIDGWISRDHIALFPRYIGADLFVADAPSPAPYHPDVDPRTVRGSASQGYNPWPSAWTFFYPKDRLIGLLDVRPTPHQGEIAFPTSEQDSSTVNGVVHYSPGAGNRSFRHPFLVNATLQSPLRGYIQTYADELRSRLDASDRTNLQAVSGVTPCAQPTFIFDAEQAHIVQRPDKHSCIYMLWFLTQAKVPGADPNSTNEADFIWNTFKVPGSEGWTPPTKSEIYENAVIASPETGFATTTGKTLAELYAIERAKQNPSAELGQWTTADTEDYRQHWPSSFSQLQALLGAYANSASILPDDPRVRGIMLWWMEVCAKAEGAIWENAVFGPLHAQFPGSKFINYTQMTTDGRVDTSSTVHDLSQLPTPGWPESDARQSPASGAPLIDALPRAVWSTSGANSQWRDGGPMDENGKQRRVNFFPQHIQGQTGAVAEKVMDSPDLYWRSFAERDFDPYTPADLGAYPNSLPYADQAANKRLLRMPDPSLPSWAQLSAIVNYEPARWSLDWFHWRHQVIFQNMLEYRHTVESAINSDHIAAGPNGTTIVQHGQRQAAMVPWLYQQLTDGTEEGTPSAEDLEALWIQNWSPRLRTLMAMLRGKDGPHAENEPARQWAAFMATAHPDLGYPVMWKRTERQRDQVYLATVSDYRFATPPVQVPSEEDDVERLNDTLRRVMGGEQVEYTVEIAGDTAVQDYPGRVTRTDVDITIYQFEGGWRAVCSQPLGAGASTNPPDVLLDTGNSPQLGGAFEVYVEATAEVIGEESSDPPPMGLIAMGVQARHWGSDETPTTPEVPASWRLLPLEVHDDAGQPIYAAPMQTCEDCWASANVTQQAYTRTVRVRRKFVLREEDFVPGDPFGAHYTKPSTTTPGASEMRLRIIQSCPGAVVLRTSIDLVQVVPVCGFELLSAGAPTPAGVPDGPGPAIIPEPSAAQDALYIDAFSARQAGLVAPQWRSPTAQAVGGMTHAAFEDYLDAVSDPGWSAPANPREAFVDVNDPGLVFLNSSFCHLTPERPGDFEPGSLVIRLPAWVRADSATTLPVGVRLVESNGTYNYATAMQVGLRQVADDWRSSALVLSGADASLLTEGTYEVTPVLTTGGLVEDAEAVPSVPAADFAIRFTLLSDCNANGVPDYAEVIREIVDQTWVDIWPMDGLIDACHPELCEPDYTGDGNVNQDDIDVLAACVSGDCSGLAAHADPDFNHDGNLDQDDVTALINTVAGNGCP